MMEERKKYLSDILSAIELIGQFINDTPNFDSYNSDLKTQSATERQLAIIGEALNKLRKIHGDDLVEKGNSIISFRNRLVHAYDSIDNSIVWAIIKNHLPELKKQVLEKL
jgi:uncharacterized protein with HEPN domain